MNPKTGGICGCLIGLEQPEPSHTCKDCGDPIPVGRTLCDLCLAKSKQPQSYPPSIVPAAVDAMKSAMIDSALLRLEEIETQAAAVKTLLKGLKQ